MRLLRPWLVIPLVAIAAGAVAAVALRSPAPAVAAALLAAALAAAIRAFIGAGAAIASVAGSAVGVLGWLDAGADVRAAVAGAAAAFAICEVVRAKPPLASPWPALGAAGVACALAPAYAALPTVAAAALVASPSARPRWVVALPIAGVLVAATAVLAASAHDGMLARLEHVWSGHAGGVLALAPLLAAVDRSGPITCVAALAGIALCVMRGRSATTAVLGVLALALVDGSGPAMPIVAGLCAGVAVGRLAQLVRLPVGQAFVGAAAGFVLVAVPAWTLALTR